jgi:hypothetical protein
MLRNKSKWDCRRFTAIGQLVSKKVTWTLALAPGAIAPSSASCRATVAGLRPSAGSTEAPALIRDLSAPMRDSLRSLRRRITR